MAFERLPGLNITVPVQQFQPAQPRPVIPTAAIAEKLVEGLSKVIEAGSPEERARRRLQLAVLQRQLSQIPLDAQLSKQVFEHSKDTENFETTEVYGPSGPHIEVKPVSPEWKAAGPHAAVPTGPRPQQVEMPPVASNAMTTLPTNPDDPDHVEPPLIADPNAPTVQPAPLANVPDIVDTVNTPAPAVPAIPPGYTYLGMNPSDQKHYAQGPDGSRIAIQPPAIQTATAPPVGSAPAATSMASTSAGPESIVPNFDEPPAVPPGYRLQRFGNDWRAINRQGHSYTIPNKWQKTTEVDQTGITHEVWVNSSDPRQRYYPPGQAKPTPASPAAQIVNQIMRQENTSTQFRAYTSAINRYSQLIDNVTKPFSERTAVDDEALIKAHAGIETPGQAITNEQLKLVHDTMGISEKFDVWRSKFAGTPAQSLMDSLFGKKPDGTYQKPRILSDEAVRNIAARDHHTVEQVRKLTAEALGPYLARADAYKVPTDQVVGVDPRKPLPPLEAGSGKKPTFAVPKMPSANRAAKEFQPGLIYPDAQGRRAKYLGDGKWQPMP